MPLCRSATCPRTPSLTTLQFVRTPAAESRRPNCEIWVSGAALAEARRLGDETSVTRSPAALAGHSTGLRPARGPAAGSRCGAPQLPSTAGPPRFPPPAPLPVPGAGTGTSPGRSPLLGDQGVAVAEGGRARDRQPGSLHGPLSVVTRVTGAFGLAYCFARLPLAGRLCDEAERGGSSYRSGPPRRLHWRCVAPFDLGCDRGRRQAAELKCRRVSL